MLERTNFVILVKEKRDHREPNSQAADPFRFSETIEQTKDKNLKENENREGKQIRIKSRIGF